MNEKIIEAIESLNIDIKDGLETVANCCCSADMSEVVCSIQEMKEDIRDAIDDLAVNASIEELRAIAPNNIGTNITKVAIEINETLCEMNQNMRIHQELMANLIKVLGNK